VLPSGIPELWCGLDVIGVAGCMPGVPSAAW
jgi:hypothetical protein